MRILIIFLVIISCVAKAQTIQVLSEDSLPIKNVRISDLTEEETVFTDKTGKADISIFEPDQLLQIRFVDFETLVASKKDITKQINIYLFSNLIVTKRKITLKKILINTMYINTFRGVQFS